MTVLVFPSSPIIGQQYNAPNEIQYVFDGVKWIVETVASTSAAVTNAVQDRVAPMFVAGPNTGITFAYNAATNVMNASITALNGDTLVNGSRSFTLEANGTLTLNGAAFSIPTNTNQLTNGAGFITSTALTGLATETYVTSRGYITSNGLPTQTDNANKYLKTDGTTLSWETVAGSSGLSISDFGRGFVNTKDNGKITTNTLYNRPDNLALNNHFELSVDNGGVVHLPDQSVINGATLKTVPGNYAGITAGPVGKDEDSWVWVDNDGAWIATKYSTSAHTWKFDNSGALTLPTNGTISYAPDDTDNWNEPTTNTIQAALDELAARVTAFENFEIDGGNAYTPAVGELLIDGYGA